MSSSSSRNRTALFISGRPCAKWTTILYAWAPLMVPATQACRSCRTASSRASRPPSSAHAAASDAATTRVPRPARPRAPEVDPYVFGIGIESYAWLPPATTQASCSGSPFHRSGHVRSLPLECPTVVSSSNPRGANHLDAPCPKAATSNRIIGRRMRVGGSSGLAARPGARSRRFVRASLAICARCPTSSWWPPIRLSVCRSPQPPARLANASTHWPGGGTLLDCRLGPPPGRGQKDH
jgi:hypothetical protein